MPKRKQPPPQLRTVLNQETGRAVSLFVAAGGFCTFAGLCCCPAVIGPPSIAGMTLVFVILLVPWFWFAYRVAAGSCRASIKRELRKFGRWRDVIAQIDAELREPETTWAAGRWWDPDGSERPDFVAVSANWLVRVRPGHVRLVSLEDVLWIFKRLMPHRSLTGREGTRSQLACRLRRGERVILEAIAEHLDDLAEELVERRPAMFTGWRSELFDLNRADPKELEAAYAARAAEYARLPPEQQEEWKDEAFDRVDRAIYVSD